MYRYNEFMVEKYCDGTVQIVAYILGPYTPYTIDDEWFVKIMIEKAEALKFQSYFGDNWIKRIQNEFFKETHIENWFELDNFIQFCKEQQIKPDIRVYAWHLIGKVAD